jgi:hypothetical protein
VLEFNRTPVVGSRFRMQGIYSEARLGFTRPRNWKIQSAQAVIRFQHSPALLANRSNLTVRVNGTSVGSTPLNRKQSQIGEFSVPIPANLIADSNEISVVAQQNNDAKCSNPADPTLWSEVLPDSKLVLNYLPQAVPLDFGQFPYPFFDELGLDPNRLAYVPPTQVSDAWLTATSRLQAAMGRLADYRRLDSRLVKAFSELQWNDRLIVVGTPAEQPILKQLKLPFRIEKDQILDASKTPLSPDVGLLMLTVTPNGGNPVLVITGNEGEGVKKAAQFLAQPTDRALMTGQAIVVSNVDDVASPDPRQWVRHLPDKETFQLSDLLAGDNQSFKDTTVRGSAAPPVYVDFRALPDDRFSRGNTMNLVYSHSDQVNPRTSAVEVLLDGVVIAGKRLSEKGASRETFTLTLPEGQLTPTSRLQVAFRLNSREPSECGVSSDQQLWGTVHGDTSFKLRRERSVDLPNLKLFQVGYPFAAPQDLSKTAIVLPDAPANADLLTLLELGTRLGRLSRSEAIKLNAYTAKTLPEEVRDSHHLIAIGTRDRLPFQAEIFGSEGFSLGKFFTRQDGAARIQTLPDKGGVIRQIGSPWGKDQVLMALTGQTDAGLRAVQDVLNQDSWFFRLKGDTALINAGARPVISATDPNAYRMEFLEQARTRRVETTNWLSKASRFLEENWLMLPFGLVTVSLVLYGLAQMVLNRAGEKKK